eukprot:365244-Chlamydomonas_euryale.AAC.13
MAADGQEAAAAAAAAPRKIRAPGPIFASAVQRPAAELPWCRSAATHVACWTAMPSVALGRSLKQQHTVGFHARTPRCNAGLPARRADRVVTRVAEAEAKAAAAAAPKPAPAAAKKKAAGGGKDGGHAAIVAEELGEYRWPSNAALRRASTRSEATRRGAVADPGGDTGCGPRRGWARRPGSAASPPGILA